MSSRGSVLPGAGRLLSAAFALVAALGAMAACDDGFLVATDGPDTDAGDGVTGDGDGDQSGDGDGDQSGDGDGDDEATDGGAAADGGSSTDGGAIGGDGDGDQGGDGDGDGSSVVRFVALGDTGEGNEDQYLVADVMETVCAAQGCDFALLLGDNFYDSGVSGTDDPQWQEKFELPYADLDFPFYATLGNHDGGWSGAGIQVTPGNHQVDYTLLSSKWRMPSRWYKHSHAHVDFYGIDTSAVFFDGFPFLNHFDEMTDDQGVWLQSEWAGASTGEWRIAYGHHPYLSNGPHGNAGDYEGIDGLPYVSGQSIKDFMEANVCGNADLYLCGHDHSRQWHLTDCSGTQLIVSGAGAKLTAFESTQPTQFQSDQNEGFVWIEIEGNAITVQFWNKLGEMEHEGGWAK